MFPSLLVFLLDTFVEMNIIRSGFFYEMEDGKPTFSHTSILYCCEDNLHVAHLPRRIYNYELKDLELEKLDGTLVNPQHVYPTFDEEKFTAAVSPFGNEVFEKEPCLLSYGCEPNVDDTNLWKTMYDEACVCEVLRTRPHPNIARYLGCRVVRGSILSLCFERYVETLRDRVEREKHNFDRGGCMEAVTRAVQHLHSLGFCHNDISPYNIMFKSDGTPILTDFDSCRPLGTFLGQKRGTPNFSPQNALMSTIENDWYGLKKLNEYLEEKCRAATQFSEQDS